MASRPAKRRKGSFQLVAFPGTPEGVVNMLSDGLGRAQDDDILAAVLVEVGREGVVRTTTYGAEDGFLHSMVAGLTYAIHDLTRLEDE
jgi:hypothetical protein